MSDLAVRAALREPFPPEQIGKVDKGFGPVEFVGHAAVTDRLNQADPDWTYHVEPVVVEGTDGWPHVIAVFGSMTVDGVTRWEAGDVERPSRYGDELKKAISDFICRAAMRFGVALDLWSKEDLTSGGSPTAPNAGTANPVPAPPSGPEGYGEGSDGPANVEGEAPAPAGGVSGDYRGSVASPSHEPNWIQSPKLKSHEVCETCLGTDSWEHQPRRKKAS